MRSPYPRTTQTHPWEIELFLENTDSIEVRLTLKKSQLAILKIPLKKILASASPNFRQNIFSQCRTFTLLPSLLI